MIRLCILGNSHAASLKLGWDMIAAQYPNVEITFFANRQRSMDAFQVENSCLVPDNDALKSAIVHTSGGLTSIDMRYFDISLLYGLDLKPYFAPSAFFSKAFLEEVMLHHVSVSVSWGLLQKIRVISNNVVFFGHTPLNAATNNSSLQGDSSTYQKSIKLLNQYVFNDYNASIIEQPLDTIVNSSQTMSKYSTGSRRLDIGDEISNELHVDQDIMHMNGDFGAHYLDLFLKKLN